MNKSLFGATPIPPVLQSRDMNSTNGSEAESFAMAKVLLACRGEGHWGSREEDGSKIDLLFSVAHPWVSGNRMHVLAQVKSGKSNGAKLNGGFQLKRDAKIAAIRTTHDICVVWVDRDNNESFWAYLHPGSTRTTQNYGLHHQVSPAMIYDLARCMVKPTTGAIGGNGVIIGKQSGATLQNRRASARIGYKNLEPFICPTLGEVEFTNVGWRHMFRRSRSARNKSDSLNLLPYLRQILIQHATSHTVTSTVFFTEEKFVYRRCDHLLKYAKVMVSQGDGTKKRIVVHARFTEEIRFPKKWAETAMLTQQVSRRTVLKSAYFKDY